MNNTDMFDYQFDEPVTIFTECTCSHEPEDHGWSNCEVTDCQCEGHYEE